MAAWSLAALVATACGMRLLFLVRVEYERERRRADAARERERADRLREGRYRSQLRAFLDLER